MTKAITEQRILVDLSHTIENGMITYKGLPGPLICDYWSREYSRQFYSAGTEFHIGKIEMVSNTGTYIDSPFHRYSEGADLAHLPLNSLVYLAGVVIRKPGNSDRRITEKLFSGIDVQEKAVLINTGWDQHWGSEAYFEGHPYLTKRAALYLRDSGASLVGIDSLNIDDTEDDERPVHTVLLEANIPIVEHMCMLKMLPDKGFTFFAVAPKIKGFGSFPVRAFAQVNSNTPDISQ